jgi:hypothetical protein
MEASSRGRMAVSGTFGGSRAAIFFAYPKLRHWRGLLSDMAGSQLQKCKKLVATHKFSCNRLLRCLTGPFRVPGTRYTSKAVAPQTGDGHDCKTASRRRVDTGVRRQASPSIFSVIRFALTSPVWATRRNRNRISGEFHETSRPLSICPEAASLNRPHLAECSGRRRSAGSCRDRAGCELRFQYAALSDRRIPRDVDGCRLRNA